MNLDRYWINLYYLSSKLLFATFLLLVVFSKDAYSIDKDFFVFLTIFYIFLNSYFFLRDRNIYNLRFLRYYDFAFVLFIAFVSKNFYGIAPIGLIFCLYSVLYLKEILIFGALTLAVWVLNISLYGNFKLEDFPIGVFYLISIAFVSTKLNLLTMVKLHSKAVERLRNTLTKMQREIAILSLKNRQFEEILDILNRIGEKERLENLPLLLKNLLNAEEVLILLPSERRKIPVGKGFVRVSIPNVLLAVRPKEKFLTKDPKYREKILLLAKLLRPYLESFLANSR